MIKYKINCDVIKVIYSSGIILNKDTAILRSFNGFWRLPPEMLYKGEALFR